MRARRADSATHIVLQALVAHAVGDGAVVVPATQTLPSSCAARLPMPTTFRKVPAGRQTMHQAGLLPWRKSARQRCLGICRLARRTNSSRMACSQIGRKRLVSTMARISAPTAARARTSSTSRQLASGRDLAGQTFKYQELAECMGRGGKAGRQRVHPGAVARSFRRARRSCRLRTRHQTFSVFKRNDQSGRPEQLRHGSSKVKTGTQGGSGLNNQGTRTHAA